MLAFHTLFRVAIAQKIVLVHDKLLKGFAIIFGGLPLFSNAESFMLIVVTKYYRIVQTLTVLGIFKGSLSGMIKVNHIVSKITNRLGIYLN